MENEIVNCDFNIEEIPPKFKEAFHEIYQGILKEQLPFIPAFQEKQYNGPAFAIGNYIHAIMQELNVPAKIETHAIALGYYVGKKDDELYKWKTQVPEEARKQAKRILSVITKSPRTFPTGVFSNCLLIYRHKNKKMDLINSPKFKTALQKSLNSQDDISSHSVLESIIRRILENSVSFKNKGDAEEYVKKELSANTNRVQIIIREELKKEDSFLEMLSSLYFNEDTPFSQNYDYLIKILEEKARLVDKRCYLCLIQDILSVSKGKKTERTLNDDLSFLFYLGQFPEFVISDILKSPLESTNYIDLLPAGTPARMCACGEWLALQRKLLMPPTISKEALNKCFEDNLKELKEQCNGENINPSQFSLYIVPLLSLPQCFSSSESIANMIGLFVIYEFYPTMRSKLLEKLNSYISGNT